MRKRWILWTGGVLLVYLVGVSIAIFASLNRVPDLYSSPTEIRDSPEFESGRLGILKPVRRAVENDWPADIVLPEPEIFPGDGDGFLIEWRDELESQKRTQPNRWTGSLEGDDEIELVAFASWIPQADDDVGEDADWKATPVFRDAKSLEPLTGEALDALGVPEEFRSLTPPKRYRTPKIRLLFRSKNMEFVRFIGGKGGDVRTGAAVTYNLDDLGEEESMCASAGDWTRMDLALLVWHDTPVKLHLQLLTGEPEVTELERRTGAQVVFGDCLRIQWLDWVRDNVSLERHGPDPFAAAPAAPTFTFAPSVSEADKRGIEERKDSPSSEQAWIGVEEESGEGSLALVRVSSEDYLESHCGWITETGAVDWYWDMEGDIGQGTLATTERSPNPDRPLKLVFLPKVTELTFDLAGLPDLPNSRDIEDLFDVRIPRITLPEDPESAEDQLIGFLSVSAEVAWTYNNLWDEKPPAGLPADRTFRNQTPRELLVWYKQVTPGARIKYDDGAKVLYVNEDRENFWDTFKSWISGLRYLF